MKKFVNLLTILFATSFFSLSSQASFSKNSEDFEEGNKLRSLNATTGNKNSQKQSFNQISIKEKIRSTNLINPFNTSTSSSSSSDDDTLEESQANEHIKDEINTPVLDDKDIPINPTQIELDRSEEPFYYSFFDLENNKLYSFIRLLASSYTASIFCKPDFQ